jgi:CRISPR/Cas system CSM-associated protein Csm5 (group 7 of RAMP superfamily)
MTESAAFDKSSLNSFLGERESLRRQLTESGNSRKIASQFTQMREISLFAGSPKCYIPGSSLKGAIRTAIISELIQRGDIPLDRNSATLKNELAQGFNINSRDNRFFKNLLISDSDELCPDDMGVAGVAIYSQDSRVGDRAGDRVRRPSGSQQTSDTYCEILMWDSNFKFEIKLRKEAMTSNYINVSSIKQLLEIVDRFYRKVWDKEAQNRSDARRNSKAIVEFYREPPNNAYLLRIGFGSGQLSTSILVDYQKRFNGQDKALRQGRVYKQRFIEETGRDLRTRAPYPFTAKSAKATDGENEMQLPLGWVLIPKDGNFD